MSIIKVNGKFPVNIELEGVSFNVYNIGLKTGAVANFRLSLREATDLRDKLTAIIGSNFFYTRDNKGRFVSEVNVKIQEIRTNPELSKLRNERTLPTVYQKAESKPFRLWDEKDWL